MKKTIISIVCILLVFLIIFLLSNDATGVSGAIDASRVYSYAIQNNNISLCDKIHMHWYSFGDITNDELVSMCYQKYVESFPNENVANEGRQICNVESCRLNILETQTIAIQVSNSAKPIV